MWRKGHTGAMSVVLSTVRHAIAPLTRTRFFRWFAPTALPWIERVLGRASGGRIQLSALLVPSLVLRSIGAHTGEVRETYLMYTPDGHGRAIVAGTSFARAHHPGWTYNLLAHPDADIVVHGRALAVRATPIRGADREQAWRRIERQWPGYRQYERDSSRTVRLFRLQPIASLT